MSDKLRSKLPITDQFSVEIEALFTGKNIFYIFYVKEPKMSQIVT